MTAPDPIRQAVTWLADHWLPVMAGCWAVLVAIAIVEHSPGPLLLGVVAWFAPQWMGAGR